MSELEFEEETREAPKTPQAQKRILQLLGQVQYLERFVARLLLLMYPADAERVMAMMDKDVVAKILRRAAKERGQRAQPGGGNGHEHISHEKRHYDYPQSKSADGTDAAMRQAAERRPREAEVRSPVSR